MNEHGPQSEILLTGIPELKEIRISRPGADDAEYDSTFFKDVETAERTIANLGGVYVEMGEGEHSFWEISKRTDVSSSTLIALAKRTEELGRQDVIRRVPGIIGVYLGGVAVAMRKATDAELAAQQNPRHAADLAAYEARVQKELEADTSKVDLTAMDHIVCTIDGSQYYFDLDSSEAVLLARMLEAARTMRAKQPFTANTYMNVAWEAMPTTERRLFTDSERQVFGKQTKLQHVALRYIHSVLSQLGITRPSSAYGDKYEIAQPNVVVEPSGYPRPDAPNARVIMPYEGLQVPTTIPAVTGRAEVLVSPMAEMYARVAAGTSVGRMEQQEALDLLHKVMLREGKQALGIALDGLERAPALPEAIDQIHDYIKRILGSYAYGVAHKQNVIRGNTLGENRMMHQAGRRNLEAVKWYIGTKDDPEGSVDPN